MKFFLYIILIAYSLQLTAHSQKREQLITHWRGDKKTYSFTENGDWAAHKLSFAVKTGRAITDDRLIWKRNTLAGGDSSQIYASYSSTSGKTTFAITILQVDAEDLPGTDYVWDLEATDTSDTTDVATLFDGVFRIKPDTQTRFDGVNIPPAGTRFHWAPLDSSAHEPGFLINRNSTNLATWISKDSTKKLLDVDDLENKTSHVVSVLDYIAENDTTGDWGGAINAAIEDVRSASGTRTGNFGNTTSEIFLPAGYLRINEPIKTSAGISLTGQGASTEIVKGSGFQGKQLIEFTEVANGFVDDAKIRNIKLTGTGVRGIGCADTTTNISNCVIENITLNTSQGVVLDKYTQGTIIKNIFSMGPVDTLLFLYGNFNFVQNIDKEGGLTGNSVGAYIYLEDVSGNGTGNSGNELHNILLEGATSANKTGIKIAGGKSILLKNYWWEPTLSDGYMLRIEGSNRIRLTGYLTSLLEGSSKVKVDSTDYVDIEDITTDGSAYGLYDLFECDSVSTILMGTLHTRGYDSPYRLSKLKNFIFNRVYSRLEFTERDQPGYLGLSPIHKPMFSGKNYLSNPSFENGDTGWSYYGDDSGDSPANTTSAVAPGDMLKLTYDSTGTKGIFQSVSISSNMVGKQFHLTAFVKADSTGGVTWISPLIDGCGITAITGLFRIYSGDWGILTQTFTPLSAGTLVVGAFFINPGIIYLDEFVLTQGGSF